MTNSNSMFLFTDLERDAGQTPFDGFIPGTFTDMWGQKVKIESRDLSLFLERTQEAIENTKTESGEIVGLPIDAQGHDHGDGAGWTVGAELGENSHGKTDPVSSQVDRTR